MDPELETFIRHRAHQLGEAFTRRRVAQVASGMSRAEDIEIDDSTVPTDPELPARIYGPNAVVTGPGTTSSDRGNVMSVSTGPGRAERLTARQVRGLRLAGFATFVILVIQSVLGIFVNLYVTVPSADHLQGFGQTVVNAPAGLTLHIALGLMLILATLGFLVQAILARQPALIAAAVLGLLSMIGAAASGGTFTRSGQDDASMAMAALAAVGLLCYGTSLFLLPRPASRRA